MRFRHLFSTPLPLPIEEILVAGILLFVIADSATALSLSLSLER
jgi:hypothetical protein